MGGWSKKLEGHNETSLYPLSKKRRRKKTVFFPADVPERTQHEDNVGLKAVLVQFVQKCIHIAFVAASCEAEEDLDVL